MNIPNTAVSDNVVNMIAEELKSLYEQHKFANDNSFNEDINKIRPDEWMLKNLPLLIRYIYHTLYDLVKRFRIADDNSLDFIITDTKSLCLLEFKPYFRSSMTNWVNEMSREYDNLSHDYKFEHGIIDDEPPNDLYNSMIVYFKDFVINLSI